MNSLNGVLVNNIVIKEHILEEDDVCMLGGKQESHVGDKIDKPQTDVIYKFKYNPEYSLLGKGNNISFDVFYLYWNRKTITFIIRITSKWKETSNNNCIYLINWEI